MKKKLPIIAIILIFIIGLGIMSYPLVSSMINNSKFKDGMNDYTETVKKLDKKDYTKLFKSAKKYNHSLTQTSIITDPFDEEAYKAIGAHYNDVLNVDGKGLIGYVVVPRIDVNLPIYHGSSKKVLEKGAGHLQNTSMPIGGKSTHAVISAHTGFPDQTFFDNLTDLVKGDIFYIKVLDKTLAYKVDQIKVVLPEDTNDLRIIPDEDHVTLLTCTPYGINTHRLLVRGVCTKYVPEEVAKNKVVKQAPFEKCFYFLGYKIPYWVAGAVIGGFVLLVVIIVLIAVRKNKKKSSLKHIDDNSEKKVESDEK